MTTRNFRVNNGLSVGTIVISATENTITGLSTSAPTADGDVANKKYVDDGLAGLSQNSISQGNSNITVTDSGTGSIGFTVDNTAIANMTVAGLIPTVDSDGTTGYSLGSASFAWKDIFVSAGSLYINGQQVLSEDSGTIVVSADADQNLQFATTGSGDIELDPQGTGVVTVKGTLQIEDGSNITNSGGNSVTFGNPIAVDSVIAKTTNGNLSLSGNGTGIVSVSGALTVTGNLQVNGTTTTVNSTTMSVADINITVASGAANAAAANGAGITVDGASATMLYVNSTDSWDFNKAVRSTNGFVGDVTGNLTGTATAAEYSDVAERFASDSMYEPGTVVALGGSAEITAVAEEASDEVFGVISSLQQAAFKMNGGAGSDETHPYVAMTGRVDVKVIGPVNKGDRLVSASTAGYARAATKAECTAFNVIGRALKSKVSQDAGSVLAAVRVTH